ncbi:MAG TPA: hypothetical protein DD417_19355 [Elusimicrobia bacterium]|nr:hypothetical protein [Elusimicrobiota bacterium]
MGKRRWLFAAVLAFAAAREGRSQPLNPAQGMNPWEKLKLGEYVQSVKFGGDMRLREDYYARRSPGKDDRGRQRFRLRLGADVTLPHYVRLGLRFASGTGEQVSTNQSMDNLSSQKGLWIDQAYLRWAPFLSDDGTVHLTGGRGPNPLWRTYSSDIVWDDDLNPEGLSEGVEWLLPGAGLTVFANALQMVVDEDANTPRNQWLFSQQAGAEVAVRPLNTRLRLSAAYHKWSDVNRGTLSQAATQEGNRRSGSVLSNRFGVAELTGELSTWIGAMPLSLQGTLIRNYSALKNVTPRARDGYQCGFILGRAKAWRSWEAAWFKKYSQSDSTVADVADSDFGDGGTNRQGHIFWVAYNPQQWLQVKAKYFTTKVIDNSLASAQNDMNRFQADISVKF